MKNLHYLFSCSSKQLKDVRNLVLCGVLLAMKLALAFFSIQLTPFLRIGFSFLTMAIIGLLFGPVIGGMFGALSDVLSYFVQPSGPFYVGFTIVSIATGIFYGIMLYHKKITLKRCVATEIFASIFINMILNTLALSFLYGKGFLALLSFRVFKDILSIPINSVLLFVVLRIVEKIETKSHYNNASM